LNNDRITIERDQSIKKLEASLFQKLSDIVTPTAQEIPKNNIRSVSPEEALKELLELEKTSQRV